jgi:hypothetical protein
MPTGIGLALLAAGTVVSVSEQKKASKAQARQQGLSARRSQRQAIREAQIRRAQSQVQAGAMGVTGGSGLAGGQASLSSQLAGNLGFAGQMSGLSQQITMAQSKAQTAGDIAGLGMQAFQNSDSIKKAFS